MNSRRVYLEREEEGRQEEVKRKERRERDIGREGKAWCGGRETGGGKRKDRRKRDKGREERKIWW